MELTKTIIIFYFGYFVGVFSVCCLMAFYLWSQYKPRKKEHCEFIKHSDIERYKQWFNAVQDLNPEYLETDDYKLAKKLYEFLLIPVSKSIKDKL